MGTWEKELEEADVTLDFSSYFKAGGPKVLKRLQGLGLKGWDISTIMTGIAMEVDLAKGMYL